MARLNVGDRVKTEWGPGKVTEHTGRSVTIKLDSGEGPLNIVTGTPGYDRITLETAADRQADFERLKEKPEERESMSSVPWTHKSFGKGH